MPRTRAQHVQNQEHATRQRTSWERFPPEIRQMILSELLESVGPGLEATSTSLDGSRTFYAHRSAAFIFQQRLRTLYDVFGGEVHRPARSIQQKLLPFPEKLQNARSSLGLEIYTLYKAEISAMYRDDQEEEDRLRAVGLSLESLSEELKDMENEIRRCLAMLRGRLTHAKFE